MPALLQQPQKKLRANQSGQPSPLCFLLPVAKHIYNGASCACISAARPRLPRCKCRGMAMKTCCLSEGSSAARMLADTQIWKSARARGEIVNCHIIGSFHSSIARRNVSMPNVIHKLSSQKIHFCLPDVHMSICIWLNSRRAHGRHGRPQIWPSEPDSCSHVCLPHCRMV